MAVNHFYFDHNASTPLAEEVSQLYATVLGEAYGNASSIHHFGQKAKGRLDRGREQLAWFLNCDPKEIVFTSGGTEANNLALFGLLRRDGPAGRHVITTEIEHPAVLNACHRLEREGAEVAYLPVGSSGAVDPGDVRAALRPETALITVMHVNNETGVIQPIDEIAAIAREAEVPFHCDGVQAAGKLPMGNLPPEADFYAISGHKLYGPKGIGALYVRSGAKFDPILFGGRQERGRRPGTPNAPAAAAFGLAAKLARKAVRKESGRLAELRDRLEQSILDRIPGCTVNGSAPRVPNTANIRFDGIGGEAMLIALDLKGYAAATGSACSSGSVEPSHVLTAMGLTKDGARSSLRFSLGRSNDAAQVDGLIEAVVAAAAHLRKVSPVAHV